VKASTKGVASSTETNDIQEWKRLMAFLSTPFVAANLPNADYVNVVSRR
jgi:hypothetical protein